MPVEVEPPPSCTRTLAEEEAAVGARWERTRGSRIGRYVIEARIGAGAMGVVYKALDPELGRHVAVKMAHASQAHSRRGAERFAREARAMAALHHPHVVQVYDYGVRDDEAYLVMELLEASTLRAWLDTEPDLDARLRVLREAGQGLAAAHEAGLVHRDIKPSNVLITAGGRAKVTDFGLARSFGDDLSSSQGSGQAGAGHSAPETLAVTAHGVVLGTPLYMSPEQHRAETLTPQSDQYSFCLTAYEVLAGRKLFDGASITRLEMMKEEGPPRDAFRSLPRRVARALRRGLQPHPRDRFPDVLALLRALGGRQRGPWIVGALALAAPLVVAASVGMQADTHCEGAAEVLWTAEHLQGLRRAYGSDPELTERAAALFDGEATAWLRARQQSCDFEPRARDLAWACLDRRRDAFEAVRERVAVRGVVTPNRVLSTVAGLPSAGACLRPAAARLASARTDPTTRAYLDEVDRRTAQARDALRRGDPVAAHLELKAAQEAAEAIEPPHVRAAPLTDIGDLLDSAGAPARASEVLRRAYDLARDGGDDRRAAGAAVHLIWVEGVSLGNSDEGRRWARDAQTRLEHAEAKPDIFAAQLNNLAAVAQREGDLDRALTLMLEADEVASAASSEGSPARENVLRMAEANRANNIGAMHYWKGDYAEALAAFRRSVAATDAARGVEHPASISALEGLARAAEAVGDLDLARSSARAMIRTIERHRGADHPSMGPALRSLASVEYALGNLPEVRRLFERVIELLEDDTDPDWRRELATAQVDLCAVLREMGELRTAATLAREAYEVLDAASDPRLATHRAGALRELALVHAELGEHDAALAYMDRADVALGDTRQEQINQVVFAVARVHVARLAGRYDEAVDTGRAALAQAGEVLQAIDGMLLQLELIHALGTRRGPSDLQEAASMLRSLEEKAQSLGAEARIEEELRSAHEVLKPR